MIRLEDILPKEKFEKTKTKDSRKIFAEVFDERTKKAISKLISKKLFSKIEDIISTGKEGNVFLTTNRENKYALKIYRIETSSFDNMRKYIEGDNRFQNKKGNKQSIIFEWTKKEYKNLLLADKVGVSVPYPIAYFKNVLLMEFIGNKTNAKQLKDISIPKKDIKKVLNQIVLNYNKLLYKANLVHADFSEYNILYYKGKVIFIDFGQAVTTTHPHAKEFYIRDLENIIRYFKKQGLEIDMSELKEWIKEGKVDLK